MQEVAVRQLIRICRRENIRLLLKPVIMIMSGISPEHGLNFKSQILSGSHRSHI